LALYALDEDDYIFAPDAKVSGSYRCLECGAPVKVRRGRDRVPHFYHLQRAPTCRLYSKSEDHLVVQLQLQRLFSEKPAQMERLFFPILRIADLIWEKEKIAFEIQCSTLDSFEAEKRVFDYSQAGYSVVWLLDDRIFNKRFLRPAEEFLRTQYCYFFAFDRDGSRFYDQMEILLRKKRLKKGFPLKVYLSCPIEKPFFDWPNKLPRQIAQRIQNARIYFRGDLIEKVMRFPAYFEKWHNNEIELTKLNRAPSKIYLFFKRYIACPYDRMLMRAIERVNRPNTMK
jgi:competence protein CoiA